MMPRKQLGFPLARLSGTAMISVRRKLLGVLFPQPRGNHSCWLGVGEEAGDYLQVVGMLSCLLGKQFPCMGYVCLIAQQMVFH